MSDTFERVRKVVAESADVNTDAIQWDTSVSTGLPIDSLTKVEILMNLEGEFGVVIDEGDALRVDTIKEYVDYIDRALQNDMHTFNYI